MRFYILLFFACIYFNQVRSDCSNLVTITDFGPSECDIKKNEYFSESVDGSCTPGCVKKVGLDSPCNSSIPCTPGLKCEDNICVIDYNSDKTCFLQKSTPSWTPNCLPDGSFAPKQCKGEAQNGRCYCYSSDGKKIFGEEWSYKAQNMACACSRRRYELEKQGRTDVTLHCDYIGNYEPLQCDSESCWCADPQTGELAAPVVPEEMLAILPCYNKTLVGAQYLRKCESQAIAQAKIKFEFLTHGTQFVTVPYLICDWDGSYGRLKVDKAMAFCIWRDGSDIPGYFTPRSEMKGVNCNCARDSMIYGLAGKEFTKLCSGNGNYHLLQHYEDDSYCVDHDGFITFGPEKDLVVDDCLQYLP